MRRTRRVLQGKPFDSRLRRSLRAFDVWMARHERACGSPVGELRASRMVRKKGLEPSRYCYRQPLKLVRLPIPPLPQVVRVKPASCVTRL